MRALGVDNPAVAFPPHSLSPAEQSALLAAERQGAPFLAYRDGLGDLRFVPLPARGRITIGRTVDNDVILEDDPQVSRAHAQLEPAGGGWTVVDDGMSRNGTFVNGEKVMRHQRLADRDALRIGTTMFVFRAPGAGGVDSTIAAERSAAPRLTTAERRVLVALCRPLLEPGLAPTPPSNAEIAGELFISLPGVKGHVRSLCAKLELDSLPQNRKRAELARKALELGLVTARDL